LTFLLHSTSSVPIEPYRLTLPTAVSRFLYPIFWLVPCQVALPETDTPKR